MPLAAGEVLEGGRVRDAYGRPSFTTSSGALPAGAYWSGGFLRDSDGRVLVVLETLDAAASAGSTLSGGFLRDSLGRLVVAQASGPLTGGQRLSGGEVRDSAGRLVLAAETLGAALGAGDFLSGGVRDSYGRRIGAGLAVAFDPLTLPGLVGWWKADALALADGAAVATWPDSSGNGNDATNGVAGERPTYKTGIANGLPVLRFDAVDDALQTALAINGALTILAVYAWSGAGAGSGHRVVRGSNNWLLGPYTGQCQFFCGAFIGTPPALTGGQFIQQTVRQAAANGAAENFLNGASLGTGTASAAPGTLRFGTLSGVDSAASDVAEIIACNQDLSTANRQAAEAYLKSKWGTP